MKTGDITSTLQLRRGETSTATTGNASKEASRILITAGRFFFCAKRLSEQNNGRPRHNDLSLHVARVITKIMIHSHANFPSPNNGASSRLTLAHRSPFISPTFNPTKMRN